MMLRLMFMTLCLAFMGVVLVAKPAAPVFAQTDTSTPVPLFSPQDDKYRFKITLPQLGFHFQNDGQLVYRVVDFIVNLLTLLVGILAFGYFIYGGITYITAGPDPGRVDTAKKIMIGSIIGMCISALAYVIVEFVIFTITSNI